MAGSQLPTGTITFLLTDVEGSTRLWQERQSDMGGVIERHDSLIAEAVKKRGGVLVKSKGEGDSTFSVFTRPTDAIAAAVDLQRALAGEPWPAGISVKVRAGIHTGEAQLRDGDYFGTTVNRCARIKGIGHGGQTIVSSATAEIVADALPPDVSLRELGVHRLRDLARPEQIFQVDAPGVATEFPPLASLERYRHNLPAQRTSFVGREEEIALVRKYLENNRLVTLTGVGGCGKTRLALHVAAEMVESFADGVFFVDLVPARDLSGVLAFVVSSVGFDSSPGRVQTNMTVGGIADAIGRSEMLLVLDNCEHIIDVCAEMADEFLGRCPNVTLLATSREALEVEGEQTHTVPSLTVADDAESSDAVHLFAERATAVRESFMLTPDVVPSVVEVCRRLDGIPLAIELAAAQVSHLSPSQIATRLDDRFALLTGGRRRVQRQQTLAATLDWSYGLLSPDEQVLLRRLAVFPATFSLDAVEAVAGPDLSPRAVASMRKLVSKSLVITQPDTARYRLLETVRLYAEEKLLNADEVEETRNRHRDHVLSWEEPQRFNEMFRAFSIEIPNLDAAIAWSEHQGRVDLAARIAALAVQSTVAADISLVRRTLDSGIESGRLEGVALARVLAARAWIGIGMTGDPASIASFAERSIEVDDHVPYFSTIAYGGLALMRSFQGLMEGVDRSAEVEELLRLATDRADGLPARRGASLLTGLCRVNTGDFDGAADELGAYYDEHSVGTIGASLALALHLSDRVDEEREVARTESERSLADPWPDWAVYRSLPLGLSLARDGRFEEALDHLRRQTARVASYKIPGIAGTAAVVIGAVHTMAEDFERAAVMFGAVRRCFLNNEVRSPTDVALYRRYLALVRQHVGDRGRELRDRGMAMTPEDAISFGLA